MFYAEVFRRTKHWINARIISIANKCNYAKMYYSPVPEVQIYGHGNCYNVGECKEGSCASFSASSAHTIWPELTGRMRVAQCAGHPGCAGNGCFKCVEACMFSAATFSARDSKVVEVGRCVSWGLEVEIEFSVIQMGRVETKTLKLIPGTQEYIINNVRESLISVSTPPNPINEDCICMFCMQ